MPSTDSLLMRLPNCNFSRNLCNLEENPCHQIFKGPNITFEKFLYFQFENTCSSVSGIGEVFLEILDFVHHVFHYVSLLETCHIQEWILQLMGAKCCSLIPKFLVKCFI